MKSILIHKLLFFSNEWHFSMWNSPCLLEFLDLIIIGFLAHAKPAYIVSRNSPLDLIHLFTRAILNLHWFCHFNEHHFFHACLIIKYHMHFLWQAFQNMRLHISIQLISFTIPELVILNTTHFNKLHLDIGVNSSSLTHISIHMIIVACYYFITRPWRGIHLVLNIDTFHDIYYKYDNQFLLI